MKTSLTLIFAGQMKRLANASKNFVLMMIKVKEKNDDTSKAFEGGDPNHKYEMVKIIYEYDGVVLMQKWRPICYHSKTFSTAISNYPTCDKEMYAFIHSVKKWKHYLMHKETIIHIDNQPLQYLHSQTKL